jgi:hypothetical protein
VPLTFDEVRDRWLAFEDAAQHRQPGAPAPSKFIHVTVKVDEPQRQLPRFASLAEVVNVFGLTDDQARAFNIVGHGLLMAFLRDEEETPEEAAAKEAAAQPADTASRPRRRRRTEPDAISAALHQVLVFLHGMGGSGKSLTIHAMIALAQSWNRPQAILTSAKSGVAAVNVDGYTVDSLTYKTRAFFNEVRAHISLY